MSRIELPSRIRSPSELDRLLTGLSNMPVADQLRLLALVARKGSVHPVTEVEFLKLSVERRYELLRRIYNIDYHLRGRATGPMAARWLGMSYSYFHTLSSTWNRDRDIVAMIPRATRKARPSTTPEKRAAITAAIDSVANTTTGPITLATVVNEMRVQKAGRHLPPIGTSLVQKALVEAIPSIRDGNRLLPAWAQVADRGVAFGEVLVLDHVWTDRWAIDREGGWPGRVLATLVFDGATRMVLGKAVSFQEPSATAALAALAEAHRRYTAGYYGLPAFQGTTKPTLVAHFGQDEEWDRLWASTRGAFTCMRRRSPIVSHGAFATKAIGRTLGGVTLIPRISDAAPPQEIMDDVAPPVIDVAAILFDSAVTAHNNERRAMYPDLMQRPTRTPDSLSDALARAIHD